MAEPIDLAAFRRATTALALELPESVWADFSSRAHALADAIEQKDAALRKGIRLIEQADPGGDSPDCTRAIDVLDAALALTAPSREGE